MWREHLPAIQGPLSQAAVQCPLVPPAGARSLRSPAAAPPRAAKSAHSPLCSTAHRCRPWVCAPFLATVAISWLWQGADPSLACPLCWNVLSLPGDPGCPSAPTEKDREPAGGLPGGSDWGSSGWTVSRGHSCSRVLRELSWRAGALPLSLARTWLPGPGSPWSLILLSYARFPPSPVCSAPEVQLEAVTGCAVCPSICSLLPHLGRGQEELEQQDR